MIDSYLVEISDIISRKRTDERFYNPVGIKTIIQMLHVDAKCYKFSSLIANNGMKTGRGIPKTDQGLGSTNYLKVANVSEYFVDFDEAEVVSEEAIRKHDMILLKADDLLISRVGTVGNVSIFRKGDPKSTYSDNVIRIRLLESPKINPMYICIFLNSKYCRVQIRRFAKQSLQEVINQTSICNLIIPLPEIQIQDEITKVVLGHFRKIEEYEKEIEDEVRKISSAIKNHLFPSTDNNFGAVDHSQLLRLLETLNENAQRNSPDFRKEKTLKHFF